MSQKQLQRILRIDWLNLKLSDAAVDVEVAFRRHPRDEQCLAPDCVLEATGSRVDCFTDTMLTKSQAPSELRDSLSCWVNLSEWRNRH